MRTAALIFILFATLPVHADMHEFSNKTLHTKLGIDLPGYDLSLQGEDREIKFSPNIKALYSVGLSLQDFIGINWGFRATQTEVKRTTKIGGSTWPSASFICF
jgi:hypothetical protein